MLTTLSLSPLEDLETRIVTKKPNSVQKTTEQSECNTVVMIFIGSVLFLALIDSIK